MMPLEFTARRSKAGSETTWLVPRLSPYSGNLTRAVPSVMGNELKELYRYRELLYMITNRDIKVRYKQSVMGFLWAILMPILIVMSGIVVRYAYAVVAHAPLKSGDIASVAIKA